MKLATDKQLAFVKSLLNTRDTSEVKLTDYPAFVDISNGTSLISMGEVSRLIDILILSPKKVAPQLEPGMYLSSDGTIFKVQHSRETKRAYAKKLVPINGNRLTENDSVVHWEFQYAFDAIRMLNASNRMTLEQAKKFGIKFGVCCVCGRVLVDAESVRAGIGPVCGKRV